MPDQPSRGTLGLLLSGGLDSSILLGSMLKRGSRVQPIYVQSGLVWQREELCAVRRFLQAVASDALQPLVVLDLPLGDLYAGHWSTTGADTPGAATPDEAVYLPGRNALLLIKALLWCQMHDVETLALAVLGSSPFADAKPEFFAHFSAVLAEATGRKLRIDCPFACLRKKDVMELGRGLPLQWTFSCIAPRGGLHCGQCNKCAERKSAFQLAGIADPTHYATALTL